MKSAYLFFPFALAARRVNSRKKTVRSDGIWNFCQAIPSIGHLYRDLDDDFPRWEAILDLYRTGGEEEEKKGEEEEEDEVVNYEHFLKFLLTQPVPQCWMKTLMTFLTLQLTSIQAERLFSILGGSVAPKQKGMKLDRVRLIMHSKSNHENEEKDTKNQLMAQKEA